MDAQKIEQLAELFKQREAINLQIAGIIAGGGEAKSVSKKPRKAYTKKVKTEESGGGRARLSEIEKENIVRCWQAGDVIRVICKKFNVSPATVSRLVKGMNRDAAPEAI